MVRRALEAGYRARSFLMAERWLAGLDDVLAPSPAPCYVVTEELAEQVTGFHVHRGALASLHRQPLPEVADLLRDARSVLVLEDVVDHTNVGAIFRSGAALGFDAVLLAPRCADPLYRRAVKVAMGAVFSVPWTRLPDWYDALPQLSAAGLHDRRPHAGRGLAAHRGGGRRAGPSGAGARVRGARADVALAGERRPPGGHPDERRRRLAQRRCRCGRGLLRDRAPLSRARVTLRPASPPGSRGRPCRGPSGAACGPWSRAGRRRRCRRDGRSRAGGSGPAARRRCR